MDKEKSSIRIKILMMDLGLMINIMDLEFNNFQMDQNMKENSKMELKMEKENINLKTKKFIKELGNKAKDKVMVLTTGIMAIFLKANGKMI